MSCIIGVFKLNKISNYLVLFFSRGACLHFCGNGFGSKLRVAKTIVSAVFPIVGAAITGTLGLQSHFASGAVAAVDARRTALTYLGHTRGLTPEESQPIFNAAFCELRDTNPMGYCLRWLIKPPQVYVEHNIHIPPLNVSPAILAVENLPLVKNDLDDLSKLLTK